MNPMEEYFPVQIKISNPQNNQVSKYPVCIGIPLPKGLITKTKQLSLMNEQGETINSQIQTTAIWHDKSLRWIKLEFFATVNKNSNIEYQLHNKQFNQTSFSVITLESEKDAISINTGKAVFKIQRDTENFLSPLSVNNVQFKQLYSSIVLKGINKEEYMPIIDEIDTSDESHSYIRKNIILNGHFDDNGKEFAKFTASLDFYNESQLCKIDFTIHNPKAAKHPGGFWDLGDPGSIYFDQLSLDFKFENFQSLNWKTEIDSEWQSTNCKQFRLYQDSSGGKKWNHSIHIDRNDEISVSFKGYQLSIDKLIINKGYRASPTIICKDSNQAIKISAHIKNFWQNFPKAISLQNNELSIELFPKKPKGDYELQGGEKKTHTIYLEFGDPSEEILQLEDSIHISIPLKYFAISKAMPGLSEIYNPGPLDTLIHEGINGENNFFIKREEADEYGWRNFGELWADHETLEHGNDDSLVSHYNNQYDPIYGFARQFILTGDYRWFELMDDLARHVIDIDIYHTNLDKAEYNNGLFWHTDHYLDAGTCSHRTFSKKHMEVDHVEQSGGGPGSEHNYCKGLKYYYWITGNYQAKKSTIKMTKWAGFSNEGTNTIIEFLINFLKQDVKNIKRVLKSEYLFNYNFPLNRGTGNYLNSLLDAYDLNNDEKILMKASKVIKETIGPADDIKQRHLMTDIESHWHYTIFLQSLLSFLKTKESENTLDNDYQYALDSFCYYTQWLVDNEQPYLENSHLLIYPNDTWVAQDCRKLYLLRNYLKYASYDLKQDIENKIDLFEKYISQHFLEKKNETTRILAILMQSQINYIDDSTKKSQQSTITELIITDKKLTVYKILAQFLSGLAHKLIKLNLKNEYLWIKVRLNK